MSIIYIGADHGGYNLKEKVKEWLNDWGYTVQDVGNNEYDKDDDYTDFAISLGESVVREKTKGILICRSGEGMCIAANKVRGVRAASCISEKEALATREYNNANVLCLSADLVSEEDNQKIIKTFLETIFSSDERHIRRINKIAEYETKIR